MISHDVVIGFGNFDCLAASLEAEPILTDFRHWLDRWRDDSIPNYTIHLEARELIEKLRRIPSHAAYDATNFLSQLTRNRRVFSQLRESLLRGSSAAEHGTHNPDVGGSTPPPATNY